MRFSLMHVDETSDEVVLIIPDGTQPVAVCVPLDAVPAFLPILAEATADLPEQCCPACADVLPGHPDHAHDAG